MALSFLSLLTAAPTHGQSVSVAISDDLIVLDSRQRSGVIELVNFGAVPAEYSAYIMALPDGIVPGDRFIRWSPARAVAPANRTIPLRVAVRPPSDLDPGEYTVRLGVQARAQPLPDEETLDDQGEQEDGAQQLGFSVPIQPVIPVTIYYRHQMEQPALEMVGHLPPSEVGDEFAGAFLAEKPDEALSYVGYVSIVHDKSDVVTSEGRVHVLPGDQPKPIVIRKPDPAVETAPGDTYCLRLWHADPPRGDPDTEVCQSF